MSYFIALLFLLHFRLSRVLFFLANPNKIKLKDLTRITCHISLTYKKIKLILVLAVCVEKHAYVYEFGDHFVESMQLLYI